MKVKSKAALAALAAVALIGSACNPTSDVGAPRRSKRD